MCEVSELCYQKIVLLHVHHKMHVLMKHSGNNIYIHLAQITACNNIIFKYLIFMLRVEIDKNGTRIYKTRVHCCSF